MSVWESGITNYLAQNEGAPSSNTETKIILVLKIPVDTITPM
ncbi:hypothetical protein AA700_0220 [Acidiphilium acidophilum DSM 700]|nr:hypothetical protein AA700_0220 [Acidiphilium acidophilum DSM 700]